MCLGLFQKVGEIDPRAPRPLYYWFNKTKHHTRSRRQPGQAPGPLRPVGWGCGALFFGDSSPLLYFFLQETCQNQRSTHPPPPLLFLLLSSSSSSHRLFDSRCIYRYKCGCDSQMTSNKRSAIKQETACERRCRLHCTHTGAKKYTLLSSYTGAKKYTLLSSSLARQ